MTEESYNPGTWQVAAQNFHKFTRLPGKVRRLWAEHWGDRDWDSERMLVVATPNDDVFVFGATGIGLGFQRLEEDGRSWRCFTKLTYEVGEAQGDGTAEFVFVENLPLADSGNESWVEDVAQELIRLASRGPRREGE